MRNACRCKNARLGNFTESGLVEFFQADTPQRQVRGRRLNYIRVTWVAGTLGPIEFPPTGDPCIARTGVGLWEVSNRRTLPGPQGPTRAFAGTNPENIAKFCVDPRTGRASAIVLGGLPRTRLRGNFASCRPKRTDAIQCPPSQTFKIGRDSGETRRLRVLAGYRHFSAHAKAILRQLTRMWATHRVGNSQSMDASALSRPVWSHC